jgi:hypothetical protein
MLNFHTPEPQNHITAGLLSEFAENKSRRAAESRNGGADKQLQVMWRSPLAVEL